MASSVVSLSSGKWLQGFAESLQQTEDRSLFGSSSRVVVARTIGLDHSSIALSEHILVAKYSAKSLANYVVAECIPNN